MCSTVLHLLPRTLLLLSLMPPIWRPPRIDAFGMNISVGTAPSVACNAAAGDNSTCAYLTYDTHSSQTPHHPHGFAVRFFKSQCWSHHCFMFEGRRHPGHQPVVVNAKAVSNAAVQVLFKGSLYVSFCLASPATHYLQHIDMQSTGATTQVCITTVYIQDHVQGVKATQQYLTVTVNFQSFGHDH